MMNSSKLRIKLGWRPWMFFITTADRTKPIQIDEAIRLVKLKAKIDKECGQAGDFSDIATLERLKQEGANFVQQ